MAWMHINSHYVRQRQVWTVAVTYCASSTAYAFSADMYTMYTILYCLLVLSVYSHITFTTLLFRLHMTVSFIISISKHAMWYITNTSTKHKASPDFHTWFHIFTTTKFLKAWCDMLIAKAKKNKQTKKKKQQNLSFRFWHLTEHELRNLQISFRTSDPDIYWKTGNISKIKQKNDLSNCNIIQLCCSPDCSAK